MFAAFLLSLSSVPDAPWHDEALHGLALVIEDLAAATVAGTRRVPSRVSPLPPGEGPGVRAYADGIPQTTPAQARAALEAARAEALPHWQALLDRFPESLHVPQALYHAGVLYAEGAKPDAERSVAAFEQLVTEFPASPWAGDAHVRLIDVKLERQFDLPGAAAHARAATDWLANVAGTRRGPSATSPLPPGEGPGVRASTDGPSADVPPNISPLPPGEGSGVRASAGGTRRASSTTADGTTERACYFADATPPALPALRRTTYDIYLRAGLIAYLSERPTEAVEWFERAKPFEPERNFVVVHGEIPTGIERLIAAARSGKSLTPEEARRGDERARLILMLADVYHEGQQWEKSLELCTEVIGEPSRAVTREQRSYAHFRRGRNHYCLDGDEFDANAAFNEYAASARIAAKAPWADKAMFLAGNIQWNHNQDADAAIRLWNRLVGSYPDSEDAVRAAYFVGVVYAWSGRDDQAHRAFEHVLTKYAGSRFDRMARRHIEDIESRNTTSAPSN